jgi:predicted porin/uncharacterized coiled-coil protein SlyX
MRRSLILSLMLFLMTISLPMFGEDPASPTDNSNKQESSSRARKGSTEAELDLLRTQVASQQKTMESQQKAMESQQKTIEELKTMVGQLAQRLDSSSRVLPASYNPVGSVPQQIPSAPPGNPSTPSTLVESKTQKGSNALEWTVAGTKIQVYGHADLSYDYVDNGITPAIEAAVVPSFPPPNDPLRGNNGWLSQVSSNLSYFGVRGSHKINDFLTGIFQFETEVSFSPIPGATSDNNCKSCLGGRDSYVGVQGHWGAFKIGKGEAPYKKAIVPLDPFYNTIGDHRSIMGNSGGDNRDEFESRLPHAIWYESPSSRGLAASIEFSPGQNRSADNGAYARGEPTCSGGNGVFVISFQNRANVAEAVTNPDINPCNDGAWGNVLSTAVTYKGHGFYGFGGYEHHSAVNRLVDAVGVADEAAWRFGASYTFENTGTTGSFIYEGLKRYAANTISAVDGQPVKLAALDERTRPLATMLVLSQKLGKKDVLSADWIHAGKTPGDPGQCVSFDANNACTGFASLSGVPGTASSLVDAVNNSSNMYALGLRHTLTRNMSTYFVYARQANHADSHYDLGAVGHGVVVDKRDFTGTGIPGTRLQGVSGGMTFDF